MAFSVTVESKRLLNILLKLPDEVTKGVYAQGRKVGKQFFAFHKKQALSAKTQASSGALVGTTKGFVGRRRLAISGTNLSDITLEMKIVSGPAVQHEEGRTLTAKSEQRLLPIPMPLAKDSRGRPTKAALRLLKEFYHNARASSEGFIRVSRTAKGKASVRRGLFLLTAHDGRKYLALRVTSQRQLRAGTPIRILFHLQHRVKLKPRFRFHELWREYTPTAMKEFDRGLEFAIAAARRKAGVT